VTCVYGVLFVSGIFPKLQSTSHGLNVRVAHLFIAALHVTELFSACPVHVQLKLSHGHLFAREIAFVVPLVHRSALCNVTPVVDNCVSESVLHVGGGTNVIVIDVVVFDPLLSNAPAVIVYDHGVGEVNTVL
jgi:hypothetical protein